MVFAPLFIPQATFGAVDALDNRYARALFKPVCDYTCYIHVHRRGEEPYAVWNVSRSALRLHCARRFSPVLIRLRKRPLCWRMKVAA